MIYDLPKSLIEAARFLLEQETPLNWAIGVNLDKAQAAGRQKGNKIVWLNAKEVFPLVHPDFRVTPDSTENHIGNRMQKAIDHFSKGNFMDPPDVSVDHNYSKHPVFIGNGRHRIAASVALGHDWFPANVDPDDVHHLKRHLTVRE